MERHLQTETVVDPLDDLPESEAQWSATKALKRIRGETGWPVCFDRADDLVRVAFSHPDPSIAFVPRSLSFRLSSFPEWEDAVREDIIRLTVDGRALMTRLRSGSQSERKDTKATESGQAP